MVFGAQTHPAPVITARLTVKAILAWMLLATRGLFLRDINLPL
jgi:hypothetical protein